MNKKNKQNKLSSDIGKSTSSNADFMQNFSLSIKIIMVIVFISFASLFFIFAYDVITQSDYFPIKKILISGNNQLSKQEILNQINISKGDNIFSINLFEKRKKLISHAWIKDALIKRDLPGKIVIIVKEINPVGLVKIGNINSFLIDKHGNPFVEYNYNINNRNLNLPVISGLKLIKKDNQYSFENNISNFVINLLEIKNNWGKKYISVDVDNGIDMEASIVFINNYVSKPLRLKLGFNNFQPKLKKAEQIFNYMKREKTGDIVTCIDLFDLKNVTVKFNQIL